MAATPEQIVSDLDRRGITLQAVDGSIHAYGPLDDDIRALIRNNKSALLSFFGVGKLPVLPERVLTGNTWEASNDAASSPGVTGVTSVTSGRNSAENTLCECETECATILEYDAGLSRTEAETSAREYQHVRCTDCANWNGTPRCDAGLTPSHPELPRLCAVHSHPRATATPTTDASTASEPLTCDGCTHNQGQDWPEHYTRIYAPFPQRRAEMVFCAARGKVAHPALDRWRGQPNYCAQRQIAGAGGAA